MTFGVFPLKKGNSGKEGVQKTKNTCGLSRQETQREVERSQHDTT